MPDRKKINMIVACDKNLGIGLSGKLPWEGKLKSDLHHFSRMTKNVPPEHALANKQNAVIMGKNTWFSIPEKFRPLKGRINSVISSTLEDEKCQVFESVEEAIWELEDREDVSSIWLIGGRGIYKEATEKKLVDKIYLTRVHGEFKCDTGNEFENKNKSKGVKY